MYVTGRLGLFAVAGAGFVATANFNPPHATTRWPAGYRVMTVAIPADSPRGSIELASYGRHELTPDGGRAMPTIHLRLAVTNRGDDVPWTLDLQHIMLALPGQAPVGPAFVNSNVDTLPIAIVERGQRAFADLYFPLSTRVKFDSEISVFDVSWRVTTPDRSFEGRTRFEHAKAASPGPLPTSVTGAEEIDANPALGAARHWWFDPAYPWSTYFHRPGHAVPRPPTHVIVDEEAQLRASR